MNERSKDLTIAALVCLAPHFHPAVALGLGVMFLLKSWWLTYKEADK